MGSETKRVLHRNAYHSCLNGSTDILSSRRTATQHFTILRIIFICSILLHVVSLFCLTKYAPSDSMAKFMLHIQGWLVGLDIYLELLMSPVPIFPAPAGYATGLLCKWGVPVQVESGLGILMITNMGSEIVLWVLHKHQSVLVGSSPFRLTERANRLVHIGMTVAYVFPPAAYSTFVQSQQITDELLQLDPRNITWISQRGCYFYQKKEPYTYAFVIAVFMIIFAQAFFLSFLFFHMKHILRIHLMTPMLLMVVPASILFIGLAANGIVSFEQCLILFLFMMLHPIAHNVLLLSPTPSFNRRILWRNGNDILVKPQTSTYHSSSA